MKKFIRFCLFIFILFILLEAVSLIFIPNKSNLLQFGYYNKTKYDLLSEPNDTIDVAFLGDSVVYNGITPMHIWKNYGFTTYDCAVPAATMDEIYKYAQIIAESQHPKLVMMDADSLYRNPKSVHKFKIKMNNLKKIVPLFTYHNNWKQLASNEWVNQYKGFKYSSKVNGPEKIPAYKKTKKARKISNENLEIFDNMVKLFRDNNVEFMLMELPNVYWSYKRHNATVNLTKQYDLELLTIRDKDFGLDWFNETKDKGVHMNYKGALKLSDYIAEYIKSKNIVVDHRNDPKYNSWNRAYKIYTNTLFD